MDWIERWRLQQEAMPYFKAILKDHEQSFWAGFSAYYDGLRCREAPAAIMEKLGPYLRGMSSVLEIGAGTGAITMELALRVPKVSALDASPHMLEILAQKARDGCLANIEIVNSPWEDAHVGPHDMVIASGCTYAFHRIDLAIEKMLRAAQKCVVFISDCNRKRSANLDYLVRRIGWDTKQDSEEPLLYNVLFQMGLYPDVLMVRSLSTPVRFQNRQHAVNCLKLLFRLTEDVAAEMQSIVADFENPSSGEVDLGTNIFDAALMIFPKDS